MQLIKTVYAKSKRDDRGSINYRKRAEELLPGSCRWRWFVSRGSGVL
ncbi:MAG: hypothetical protein ACLR4Z_14820 [Butyricicoccaceae bacterium]